MVSMFNHQTCHVWIKSNHKMTTLLQIHRRKIPTFVVNDHVYVYIYTLYDSLSLYIIYSLVQHFLSCSIIIWFNSIFNSCFIRGRRKKVKIQHIHSVARKKKEKIKKISPQVKPLVLSNTYINIHIKINS